MGGSSWSDDHYAAKASFKATRGIPTMAHDSDAKAGKVAKLHPSMNVKGVKMRESRDSDAHPKSRAVAVLLDVTGSMSGVPLMIQKKLPSLMGLLIRKGNLPDPHILVGAVGDAISDSTPIQIGQFEAGIEIDDNITNLYLEGGGGGSSQESYELALWFMLERTSIDCYEKRGEKGFLFVIGDEQFYPQVRKTQIEQHLGNSPQDDIPTVDVIKQLQEKYEVFYVMPNMTSHYGEAKVVNLWKSVLGQNVLMLDEPDGICELIASTIAVSEGSGLDGASKDLTDAGTSASVVSAVSKALTPYASTAGEKATALKIPSSDEPSGLVEV